MHVIIIFQLPHVLLSSFKKVHIVIYFKDLCENLLGYIFKSLEGEACVGH